MNALAVPLRPDDLAPHYDLTISHPAVEQPAFAAFDRWLARAACRRGLSCALLHDGVVQEAVRRLGAGRLWVGFHLDYFALWQKPGDPYARLAQAVQDAGGRNVNPPARSRLFTDKAAAHAELLRHGFSVPETVFLRPWCPDRALTQAEWRRLRLDTPEACVYVKPANGFGGRGVVRVLATSPEAVAATVQAARSLDPQETYLVQREVRCPRLADGDGVERPAYWRVLHCFGEFTAFWWCGKELERGRPCYRPVTPAEVLRLNLHGLFATARALAVLCGLEWFSTEICLDADSAAFVVIDYVNDQCDVDVQGRWPGAPPDAFVEHIAERLAEQAARRVALPLRRAA